LQVDGLEWLERFLEACRARRLSDRTVANYDCVLRIIADKYSLDLASCTADELGEAVKRFGGLARSTHMLYATLIRMVFRFLGRLELLERIEMPRAEDRAGKIQNMVVSREDVEKLIRGASNPQDRLLIELLYESGARIGEIYNLRIKDLQFDEHGAILWFRGKSGARRRRVYGCVPELRLQVNNHPERSNAEARFFHYGRHGESDFKLFTLQKRVRLLGQRVLKRSIHPHCFRHTRATEDSRLFTDREMMMLFGWKTPNMISVYSHLSLRDVDEKDLILHGLKPKSDALKPIAQAQKCFNCKEENAPVAIYCRGCGQPLAETVERSKIKEYEAKISQFQNVAAEALTRLDNLEAIVERIKKIEEKKISP
jgi:integrase